MLLEVKNLNAGYGFLQIVRDVSLNVDTGEYVCLVGPNGAGKSTTLKTIAGLVAPGGIALVSCRSCESGKQGEVLPIPLDRDEIDGFRRAGLVEEVFEAASDSGPY